MENNSNNISFEYVPVDFSLKKIQDVAGVAVDSQDNIYYSTRAYSGNEAPVIVMNSEGKYLYPIGGGILKNPHGICIDKEDNLYVSDALRNCIFKFSLNGELLMTIGEPDRPCDNGCINYDFLSISHSSDSLNHPAKLAVSKDGDIFVADGYGNARVHRFDKDGNLKISWGNPGNEPGQFNLVHGIGIDDETNLVYVCDRENERVQVFDFDGNVQAVWNNIWRPTDVMIRGDYAYVTELGELFFVENVLYEPGTRHHHSQMRVIEKTTGKVVAEIGTADGGEKGSFFSAHCIAFNSKNEFYVGEVSFPRDEIWIAYPNGIGMSGKTHPPLQKFRQI